MQLKALVKYQQDFKILLVALGYFFFARLGYFLVFQDIYILPTWPPSGLALAFIIILGRRVWPGITIGALLANILAYWNTGDLASNSVILLSSVIATGHTLEALLGYFLVNKWVGKEKYFTKTVFVFRFLGISLLVSLVSAAIGTSVLYYQGLFEGGDFVSRFVSWWVGNLVGILLFTPFILSFKEKIIFKFNKNHLLETVLFSVGVTIVAFLLNNDSLREPVQMALPFLILPLILWLAFRFHLSIAMFATILIALISVYMTIQELGPFVMETSDNAMLILQIFISVISISTVILSATEQERTDTQLELRNLNGQLEEKITERTKELEQENAVRKKAEVELQSSNIELRKINSELDNFVYRVSHDLRAPIASMLGLISLIRSDEQPEMNELYISKLEDSAKLQDEFIQEILDQSRNSRLELKPAKIDFNDLITTTFDQLKFSNPNERVEKDIKISGKKDFQSDPWRLKVILNNILSNSIRYRNGKSPKIEVDIKIDDKEALIKIADNGRGIEEQHIGKVFNMFYRATDDNAGSGLGLYIVKETVDKLNGEVSIDSKVSVGTTVNLRIPNISSAKKIKTQKKPI
ncbi:hypothetical protein GCM10027429_29730 [Marivirga atlantica]|uniref:histidine kinase n=1 Tax=Marivirga atlantica TaxID=1548457 RepID=A0A937A9Y9_9BACT|nr:MASE1 domain-containing protein [Marivirga atlantica]MBL0766552.1 MASE1 domain-containing protein [Marivirga atlantica]